MHADHPRSIYALIPIDAALSAADFAPLDVARNLADRCAGTAHAVLLGMIPDSAIEQARIAGLDSIYVISSPMPGIRLQTHQLADLFANVLSDSEKIAYTADSIFLVAAGSVTEEIAGRLAARVNAVPLGRCNQFSFDESGHLSVLRSAFGGRLNITLDCQNGPFIAAVRKIESSIESRRSSHGDTTVRRLTLATAPRAAFPVAATTRKEQHAGLEGARLIVSGGRGIGSKEEFAALYDLAEKLGGAVGGSLPTIDAGWAPVARQIGQSGKYVAPEIYLAIGISGTPQHMAGIAPHTKIIAINHDADASIFKTAHIGVVADWREFLPVLIEEVGANHV